MTTQDSDITHTPPKEIVGYDRGTSRELVVLLHAYRQSPKHLEDLWQFIKGELPGAHFFVPQMPTSTFSFANPLKIVQGLLDDMDRIWTENKESEFDRIILVGHSLGGLLARKLYVCAMGENLDIPFEDDKEKRPRVWSTKVERIIMLAGLNRGWSISHHLSIPNLVLWTLGSWIAVALSVARGKESLIMSFYRGGSFITQLRIQWLSMMRNTPREELATSIQLIGSKDDMVSPEDNIDLVTGGEFVYLDVPYTGHKDVIELDSTLVGQKRKKIFRRALNETPQDLQKDNLQPGDYHLVRDENIEHVIFVIHGIRDLGYWTHKIARKAMRNWQETAIQGKEKNFKSITSSYGYFGMLPFLLFFRRMEKVRWLMEQYVEALARYPNAMFYYVGHSNGTYLLARALRDNPSCCFDRVVFAGSVVRTDFDWKRFQSQRKLSDPNSVKPQVGPVLSYTATSDWVVAFCTKPLELLKWVDLGSGGYDGFQQTELKGKQMRVRGTHSAAIKEETWDEIARFIAFGTMPVTAGEQSCTSRTFRESAFRAFVCLVSHLRFSFWVSLLLLAIGVGWLIAASITSPFWCGVFTVCYLILLFKIVTIV